MNLACFGKTMENVRNCWNFHVADNEHVMEKLVNHPDFIGQNIINEKNNLALIEHKKSLIEFDKPLQVGAAILDISKCVIIDSHYREMQPMIEKAGGKLVIDYGDTDSLIYEVTLPHGIDLYNDVLSLNKDLFDFSNYPKEHPLYSVANKKVPGKFSDETPGQMITAHIALRTKLYSFKLWPPLPNQPSVVKKGKGIKKNVLKNELEFEDYKEIRQC